MSWSRLGWEPPSGRGATWPEILWDFGDHADILQCVLPWLFVSMLRLEALSALDRPRALAVIDTMSEILAELVTPLAGSGLPVDPHDSGIRPNGVSGDAHREVCFTVPACCAIATVNLTQRSEEPITILGVILLGRIVVLQKTRPVV